MGETRGWLAIRLDPFERGRAENAELSTHMDSREFLCNERAVDTSGQNEHHDINTGTYSFEWEETRVAPEVDFEIGDCLADLYLKS